MASAAPFRNACSTSRYRLERGRLARRAPSAICTMRRISTTARCDPTNWTSTVCCRTPRAPGSPVIWSSRRSRTPLRRLCLNTSRRSVRRLGWIDKTRAAVKDRLTKEIGYRTTVPRNSSCRSRLAGPMPASTRRRRAAAPMSCKHALQAHGAARPGSADLGPTPGMGELVVVPTAGLLAQITGHALPEPSQPADTQAVAARARAIVMDVERQLGYEPVDCECGNWATTSRPRSTHKPLALPRSKRPYLGRRRSPSRRTRSSTRSINPRTSSSPSSSFCQAMRTACTTCASPSIASQTLA